MSKALKFFSALFVLLAGVIVAGVAILSAMDFNHYKGLIASEVKQLTGRDLVIEGGLKLEISLNPAIAVEGVTFANATFGSRPEMVKLKRLAAEVSLLPLFSGALVVDRLALDGLDLMLETDAEGLGNWEFKAAGSAKAPEKASPSSAPQSGGVLPLVKKVRIRDVNIAYRDGESGAISKLALDYLDLGADSAGSPLKIGLAGVFNGVPYKASGQLGALGVLLKGEGAYPVSLQAETLGASLGVNGSVNDPLKKPWINVTATIEGGQLTDTINAAKTVVPSLKTPELPAIGPYSVSSLITGPLDALSFSNIKVSAGKAEQLLVSASGKIINPLKAKGIDLAFAVEGKDLSALAKATGASIPPLPPFKIEGKAFDNAEGYAVSGLEISIGDSDLTGSLAADLNGERPRINANLASKRLDLDQLLQKGQNRPQESKAKPAGDGRVFSKDPLGLDGLKAVDANINFKGQRVIVQGLDLNGITLSLSLAGGDLKISPFALTLGSGALGSGMIDGSIMLDAGNPSPPLSVAINAKQIDYGAMLEKFGHANVAAGKVDLDIDLKGSGKSVREIMAGLDGKARIVTEGGKIHSGLLNFASADVLSALPFIDSKGDREIQCGVIDFRINKGFANAKTLLFETGGLTMIGKGYVNLASEKLDLGFDPRAKKASLLKLAIPVSVTGTLAEPSILPDVSGAAIGAVSGAVSTVTDLAAKGVSAVGSMVSGAGYSSAVDETNYCRLALAGKPLVADKGAANDSAKASSKEPGIAEKAAKSVGDAVDKTTENVGSAIKGVGNALGGIFGGGGAK